MKIILHKTRRTRPPNPVKAAVETADRSAVLINSEQKPLCKKVNQKEMYFLCWKQKTVSSERHLLTTSSMRGFVHNIGLLDWKLAVFSLQFLLVSWEDLYEKLTKKFLKKTCSIWLHSIWIQCCSSQSCCTCFSFVSACLMQPAFQSVQVIKQEKHWMDVQCRCLFEFQNISFHTHPADMFSVDVPETGWVSGVHGRRGNARTRQVCAAHGSRDAYKAD